MLDGFFSFMYGCMGMPYIVLGFSVYFCILRYIVFPFFFLSFQTFYKATEKLHMNIVNIYL